MKSTPLRAVTRLAALAVFVTWVAAATAQVPDHLKCYKVKDPQPKATYTADLGGLVAEPGCTIRVPAIMACVPSTKGNVRPTPPGGGGAGTPNAFGCYKIRCPKATLPAISLNDQFGNRLVRPSAPKLLCAPVATTTITTSTIVTSTAPASTTTVTCSTTTIGTFYCPSAFQFCSSHVCPPGMTCGTSPFPGGCDCTGPPPPCGDVQPVPVMCHFGACPPGQTCQIAPLPPPNSCVSVCTCL